MAKSLKNSWWIYALLAAGVVIIAVSLRAGKSQTQQGVVLSDIFHQQVTQSTESGNTSPDHPAKADPVPPMALVTSPQNGRETGFTIQVYSFQDKNRAETARQGLKNNGYQAFIVISDLGEKGVWYRVRVGNIPDAASAHKMLDDIRKAYNSGFILKPNT